MSIATDLRAYADSALEQGKIVLNQATAAWSNTNRRLVSDLPPSLRTSPVTAPTYAAVGVADLMAETVAKRAEIATKRAEAMAKRAEALPSEAIANFAKASEIGKSRLSQAQDDAVAKMVDLRSMFETLTARGEAKINDLRRDPRLARFLGEVDEAAEAVQHEARAAADTVQAKVDDGADTVQAKVDDSADTVQAKVDDGAVKVAPRNTTIRSASADKASGTKVPAKKVVPARRTPAK